MACCLDGWVCVFGCFAQLFPRFVKAIDARQRYTVIESVQSTIGDQANGSLVVLGRLREIVTSS